MISGLSWADPIPGVSEEDAAEDERLVQIVDETDAEIDGIVDSTGPEDTLQGWRFFTCRHRNGRLYPPFHSEDPVGKDWTKADCRPDKVPRELQAQTGRLFDWDDHLIPGERCGCGWRLYPSLHAVTIGAQLWPDNPDTSLDWDFTVLAGVEYRAKLAGRPTAKSRSIDETGTLRARWMRISGPLYVAPRLGREFRRGMANRYRVPVVKLDRRPFLAARDGILEDAGAGAAGGGGAES